MKETPPKRTRKKFASFMLLMLIGGLSIFAFQNFNPLVVKVLFWSFETNTAVLIGASVLAGFILFLITLLFKTKKQTSQVGELKKMIEDLNSQLIRLSSKEEFGQKIEEKTSDKTPVF